MMTAYDVGEASTYHADFASFVLYDLKLYEPPILDNFEVATCEGASALCQTHPVCRHAHIHLMEEGFCLTGKVDGF
jgi:hypothetical protein